MPEKRSRHGLTALKARVSIKGLSGIDARTIAAQSLIRWRMELVRDLGGEDNLSAQKMALVEAVTRTRLFLDHLDAYLLAQPSLVNRRKKSMLPAVRERQSLCDSLARLLGQLGLDRVEHDAGAIPESWITKIRPVEEPTQEQQTAVAPDVAETKTETYKGDKT